MLEITPSERKSLKGRAHHLDPVVTIGSGGLTPEVVREIEANLKSHELIKVKVLGEDRERREALISEICDAITAAPVQIIGKILVIYRPKPPGETKKKRRPARKQPRRTKRSFQM